MGSWTNIPVTLALAYGGPNPILSFNGLILYSLSLRIKSLNRDTVESSVIVAVPEGRIGDAVREFGAEGSAKGPGR